MDFDSLLVDLFAFQMKIDRLDFNTIFSLISREKKITKKREKNQNCPGRISTAVKWPYMLTVLYRPDDRIDRAGDGSGTIDNNVNNPRIRTIHYYHELHYKIKFVIRTINYILFIIFSI